MTTNAFIFMWSEYGIESVTPITQYENQKMLDVMAVLKDEPIGKNPLSDIITHMRLRATFNNHRTYEIYAIDCPEGTTTEELYECWDSAPQYMADVVREKGVNLLDDKKPRRKVEEIKIR